MRSRGGPSTVERLEILSILRLREEERRRIEAVDTRVHLIDAGGWFDGEIRDSWPPFTTQRYLPPEARGRGTRAERDNLLAQAEVVLGGFPPLLDLRSRSPRLRWFHQRPAGASNILHTALWGSDVVVTTTRGYAEAGTIAEYVVAAFLHFARGLHGAAPQSAARRLDHRAYAPIAIEGKTVCVIGAGGIGSEVGRRCAALGMRVVGTRRSAPTGDPPPGFSRIEGPKGLLTLLAESEFVAICCQWTAETTRLLDTDAFEAMKPGSVLVNIARGEIIDEGALIDALGRNLVRGVALDVYEGEFKSDPDPRLWQDERVLITPHVSGKTDCPRHRAVDLFCENLRAYLDGQPLKNVIDWKRGY